MISANLIWLFYPYVLNDIFSTAVIVVYVSQSPQICRKAAQSRLGPHGLPANVGKYPFTMLGVEVGSKLGRSCEEHHQGHQI